MSSLVHNGQPQNGRPSNDLRLLRQWRRLLLPARAQVRRPVVDRLSGERHLDALGLASLPRRPLKPVAFGSRITVDDLPLETLQMRGSEGKTGRLLWGLLYWIWPRCLDTMVLVKLSARLAKPAPGGY